MAIDGDTVQRIGGSYFTLRKYRFIGEHIIYIYFFFPLISLHFCRSYDKLLFDMPRKAAKSSSEIFQVLKDLHVLNDKGRALSLTHSIWEEACIQLDNVMSKKYIYLYVSQNRHGLLDQLLQHYGIACTKETSPTLADDSRESNWSMHSSDNIFPSLRTTIHLSNETWRKIAPVKVLYKDRTYETLNKGWTDVIAVELWKGLKLPCCFSFKTAKLNDNDGEIYLKFWGKCSECGTLINAYSVNKPTADGLDIHISTSDTSYGRKTYQKATIAWCL